MKTSSKWWFLSTFFMLVCAALVLLKVEGDISKVAFALGMIISLYYLVKAQKEEESETKEKEE